MIHNKMSVIGLLSILTLLGGCTSTFETQSTQEQQTKTNAAATALINQFGQATPIVNNNQVVGYSFQDDSDTVTAKIGQFFGFRYKATQTIKLSAGSTQATVESSLPVVIEVTHPTINGSTSSSWNDTLYFGRQNYVMWQFESNQELVAGKWTVAVKLNNQTIAEKDFSVDVYENSKG